MDKLPARSHCFLSQTILSLHVIQLPNIVRAINKFANLKKTNIEYLTFLPTLFTTPINIFFYFFDCLIAESFSEDYLPLIYFRGFWTLLIPVMYGSFMLLLYFIMIKLEETRYHFFWIYNGFMFFCVYMGPGVIGNMFSIIGCKVIGDKYI